MEEKKYFYHMVPKNMQGKELQPLNLLPPELYLQNLEKYKIKNPEGKDRLHVIDELIPVLNAKWGEVLQLSPIKPEELKAALLHAGFNPGEIKFYQIDPDSLDPGKTTIVLFHYDEAGNESHREYKDLNNKNIDSISKIPEHTLNMYVNRVKSGTKILYFLGVPHVLHKGTIDIEGLPVITV